VVAGSSVDIGHRRFHHEKLAAKEALLLLLLLHVQLQLHPTTRKGEGEDRAALRQGKGREK